VLENDEPDVLLGSDQAANPVEYVLHALAGCLTTSLVYHAAARGIAVQAVESYALSPVIERHSVYMPPALAIVSQVTFGYLSKIPFRDALHTRVKQLNDYEMKLNNSERSVIPC
jgi:hypothetical protein